MDLRTKYQVAFNLWCIHQNYRVAGRCPEGIAVLVDRLMERHPCLSEPLIAQGLFLELEQRLDGRRRWLLAHSSLPFPPPEKK